MTSRRAETHLMVRWSKRENDLLFHHPGPKPDGHLLYAALCGDRWRPDWEEMRVGGVHDPSFVKELEARGYDLTTLRFSVRLKPNAPVLQRRFRRKSRAWFRSHP